ncbi:hypothetical protein [Streptomyces sp. NBC_01017]|uniref:hypothetical protein n=1 Tax=Streptomyces sp. NBC_01017 TaxID=2903721 RepID=UPI003870CC69
MVAVLALAVWTLTAYRAGDDSGASMPATDSADAGFARDVDVRRLAYDGAQTQANQRGMLLGRLDLWGLPKSSPDGYMT